MNTIYRNGSNYIKIIKANFSYTILYNNIYFIKDKKINKIWKYINQQKKEEILDEHERRKRQKYEE